MVNTLAGSALFSHTVPTWLWALEELAGLQEILVEHLWDPFSVDAAQSKQPQKDTKKDGGKKMEGIGLQLLVPSPSFARPSLPNLPRLSRRPTSALIGCHPFCHQSFISLIFYQIYNIIVYLFDIVSNLVSSSFVCPQLSSGIFYQPACCSFFCYLFPCY